MFLNKKERYSNILTYSLLFFFIFLPYREVLSLISPVFKTIPDILILVLFLTDILKNKAYKKINYTDLSYLLFLFIGLISTMYNHIGIKAFIVEARSITLYYLMYFVIRDKYFANEFKSTLKNILLANTTILIILGTIEKVSYKTLLFPRVWAESIIYPSNFLRIYGVFNNPNTFGIYLVFAFLTFLILDVDSGKVNKWFYSLCVYGLALTVSRSSIIAIVLAIIMIMLFIKNNKKLKVILLISFIIGGITYFAVDYAGKQIYASLNGKSSISQSENILIKRFNDLGTQKDIQKSNANGRIFSIKTGLKIWSEHKLLGSGFGTYGDAASLILGSPIYKKYNLSENFYTDNEYIKILTETGILGTLSYILFLLALIYEVLEDGNRYMYAIIIVALFTGLFYNMFEVQIFSLFFWFLMGAKKQFAKI
ncbi:O-antigen ligase [Caldanaerobius fijiensis DSM 17918]|uniref:O-antigen ligase n=1 Tax=Caldanaerobius fijiensis DSM 17918 TaxID=1121256 RepID=A0A1M4VHP1_9THEO|nr:O-antigen ligase [Caldanaerobius fijiensis DSM 17918]